jgi:hypothetical protein
VVVVDAVHAHAEGASDELVDRSRGAE